MAIALVAVASVLCVATPAAAAPDSEGGSKSLREQLESAAKGYVTAQNKLDNLKKRQLALQLQLRQAEAAAKALEGQVGAVAAKSYRMGRVSTLSVLLNSRDSDDFLQRAMRLDMMAQVDARALGRYWAAMRSAEQAKREIDLAIKQQKVQVDLLAKRKRQAQNALAAAGGGRASGGFVSANSPSAKPARRNSDGSWPRESCSVNDPTTSGCITPRMLHAYNESRLAGFKRYTSCYSRRSSGEHPKGRACDFAAAAGGFRNVNASGGDKAYGDRLASYFVKNANRLGVMYVIWYRQIWMPGSGWRSYSGRGGPSATHTNHVHLSML
ncbi:MAG TPA: hypothetical protein VFO77_06375 [Actinoplanes sp.]|nr:hypothetical protein [Actinoplanes sp.]